MNKYKKIEMYGYNYLGMYPVYINTVYDGKEPYKIVGLRENEIELEGDFSGGTHNIMQKEWFKKDDCFVIYKHCDEELKPDGCQIHNVNCCGGGDVIKQHIEYWKNKTL